MGYACVVFGTLAAFSSTNTPASFTASTTSVLLRVVAEAADLSSNWSQPGVHSEPQDSQNYVERERPCLHPPPQKTKQ